MPDKDTLVCNLPESRSEPAPMVPGALLLIVSPHTCWCSVLKARRPPCAVMLLQGRPFVEHRAQILPEVIVQIQTGRRDTCCIQPRRQVVLELKPVAVVKCRAFLQMV